MSQTLTGIIKVDGLIQTVPLTNHNLTADVCLLEDKLFLWMLMPEETKRVRTR